MHRSLMWQFLVVVVKLRLKLENLVGAWVLDVAVFSGEEAEEARHEVGGHSRRAASQSGGKALLLCTQGAGTQCSLPIITLLIYILKDKEHTTHTNNNKINVFEKTLNASLGMLIYKIV